MAEPRPDDDPPDAATLRALLEWQIELGADEAICERPLSRFDEPAKAPPATALGGAATVPARRSESDNRDIGKGDAARIAAGVSGLAGLHAALTAFEGCEVKRGARRAVIAEGAPGAAVMIVGAAPDRADEMAGTPFAPDAPRGRLLGAMLGAIGLARGTEANVYLALALPWRPPQDRPPTDDEAAAMRPFLLRHIALAAPHAVIAMGPGACRTLIGPDRLDRLRGDWHEAAGRPVMAMHDPAQLIRDPLLKREAWADLRRLKARLGAGRPAGG